MEKKSDIDLSAFCFWDDLANYKALTTQDMKQVIDSPGSKSKDGTSYKHRKKHIVLEYQDRLRYNAIDCMEYRKAKAREVKKRLKKAKVQDLLNYKFSKIRKSYKNQKQKTNDIYLNLYDYIIN